MSQMRRARLTAAMLSRAGGKDLNRRIRRSFLLGPGSRCRESDAGGKKPEKESSFKYYLKTFMKQWKKDLAAIEDRSKARRQPVHQLPPKDAENNQNVYDYLRLEKKKALEGWNDTKTTERPLRPPPPPRPKDRIVLLKSLTSENSGKPAPPSSFDSFLQKKKEILAEGKRRQNEGEKVPAKSESLGKQKMENKALALMKQSERTEEMISAKDDSEPHAHDKGLPPMPELKWEGQYEKTMRRREKVFERMRENLKDNEPELRRLLKLRAFLTKQEMLKLQNKIRSYENKIAKEEKRIRETSRVMKIVKQIHKDPRK